ncbi:MAG: K(+)-transporting ATPase subunit C [Candidatus Eisenbacteria bacterium]|nr:K(+)-transporting ATPase subunit C [Candidatus Eisenbacteria bacterium]
MIRQLWSAVTMVLVMTLLTGLLFPVAITGLGRALFPRQAAGSLVVRDGVTVGSTLIAQGFTRSGYFHPRPSAAGSGYDGASSGGTNLGPTSRKLLLGVHRTLPDGKDDASNFDGVADLAAGYRRENLLAASAPVPADAVTRSASGLDPHISPENARLQIARVARARGLDPAAVERLAARHVEPRRLGFLGEPRVNVLQLNLDLDRLVPPAGPR